VQASSGQKTEDRAKPAHGLPLSWDEIDVGHLVLAKEDGPDEAWYPAIPTENHGNALTLHWRDQAQLPTIVRPRLKLALMYPGSN
jgi:hypothetical protein